MSSYSSLLERKIKEIEHDPAEMRQVVYDVARLALKQQLYAQRPPLKSANIQHSLSDLEAAIERVESQSAQSHREQGTIGPLGEVRRDVAADKAVPTWRSEPTLSVEPVTSSSFEKETRQRKGSRPIWFSRTPRMRWYLPNRDRHWDGCWSPAWPKFSS
jgi:hypothetical protein